MAYKEFFSISCDDCGALLGGDRPYTFASKRATAEMAQKLGWSVSPEGYWRQTMRPHVCRACARPIASSGGSCTALSVDGTFRCSLAIGHAGEHLYLMVAKTEHR